MGDEENYKYYFYSNTQSTFIYFYVRYRCGLKVLKAEPLSLSVSEEILLIKTGKFLEFSSHLIEEQINISLRTDHQKPFKLISLRQITRNKSEIQINK